MPVVHGDLQECLREALGCVRVSVKSIGENTVEMCSSTSLAELCGTLREKKVAGGCGSVQG